MLLIGEVLPPPGDMSHLKASGPMQLLAVDDLYGYSEYRERGEITSGRVSNAQCSMLMALRYDG